MDHNRSNLALDRAFIAFAVAVLCSAATLWIYVAYLHGTDAGFNEALKQPQWRFPHIEIAIGIGVTLFGTYCAEHRPLLALSAGIASLLFAGIMWLGYVA